MIPLLINDVPIECINKAAVEYYVPAKLIISVLKTENGRIGTESKNKNGTVDLGPMQINSSWLPTLYRYGFTKNDVQYDPCKNVEIGTWILSNSIASEASLNKGIGDYNSHSDYYNIKYRTMVLNHLHHIESIIGT